MDGILIAKIRKAPAKPGVYRFFNAKGNIVYIGKAGNLKARLRSYLTAGKMGGKVGLMLNEARSVRWVICHSDIEALILESQLIKSHLPRWNVLLRDDKSYFFVHITSDSFPRIYLTHQPNKAGRFIGPFTEGRALKTTLRILRGIFPYCTCSEKHKRPCLNSQIGKCPGYCCLKVKSAKLKVKSGTEYKRNINSIVKILKGQTNALIRETKKQMQLASRAQQYEKAAKLRDQMQSLDSILKHRHIIAERRLSPRKSNSAELELGKILGGALKLKKDIQAIEMIDVANIQGIWAVGGLVRFEHGQPQKQGYRLFKIKGEWSPNDPKMIAEVLKRRLGHKEWPLPELIIVDGGKTQLHAAKKAVEESPDKKITLAALAKPHQELFLPSDKRILLTTLPTSLRHYLERISRETHRFTNAYYRKLHRRSYAQ